MTKNLSKAICLLLVSSLAILSSSMLFKPTYGAATTSPRVFTELTLQGNNYTSFINETVIILGSVTIEDNATLYLENATLLIEQATDGRYNITLRNPVNGQPRIIAKGATIGSNNTETALMYAYGGSITATNFTTASLLLSSSSLEITGRGSRMGSIRATNATVQLTNATFSLPISLLTLDHCTATISDTDVDTLSARNYSNITYSDGEISKELIAFGNANVSTMASTIASVEVRDATLSVTNSTASKVVAMKNASLTVTGCVPPYRITLLLLSDNASTSIYNSMITGVSAYNYSQTTLNKTSIAGETSFLSAGGNATMNFHNGKVDHPTVSGNATILFENVTSHNIAFEKDAKLNASKLTVTESTFILGNSQVHITNSTLRGIFSTSDSATAVISNSNSNLTDIRDSSSMSIENCSVTTLRVLDATKATVSNSLIRDLHIQARSINGTFNGIKGSSLLYWNFVGNNSITMRGSDSYVPDLTLKNMQVPQNMTLQIFGNSNLTINNAKLVHVDARDNSVITLVNVTLDGYEVSGNSVVYSYWYIHIHLVNSQNAPIESANIAVFAPSGEIIESGVTDSNGWFKSDKRILANVVNSTKAEKSLVLEIRKDDFLLRELTSNFASGIMTLVLPIQTPWWLQYWYLITLIVVLAAGIVFVLIRKTKPT